MNGIAFASGMLGAIMVTVPLEFVLRVLQLARGVLRHRRAHGGGQPGALSRGAGEGHPAAGKPRGAARGAAARVRIARARSGVLAHGAVHRLEPARRRVARHALGRDLAARRSRL